MYLQAWGCSWLTTCSSLMWFRLAVCDSAENAFNALIGKTVTEDAAGESIACVNTDMLLKSVVELFILVASLAIILNLLSILHRREKNQIGRAHV